MLYLEIDLCKHFKRSECRIEIIGKKDRDLQYDPSRKYDRDRDHPILMPYLQQIYSF